VAHGSSELQALCVSVQRDRACPTVARLHDWFESNTVGT
jgi:hypothetical protein